MYKKLLEIAKKSKKHLSCEAYSSISQFLESQQNGDGGFLGRNRSGSDLYYSMFAILANLALIDKLPDGVKDYTESFCNGDNLDFIHLCTLARLYACIDCEVSNAVKKSITSNIEKYRSSDGGYHHIAKFAEKGTPYGCFLAYFAYQELDLKVYHTDRLLKSVLSCRTSDGGFSNTSDSQHGTTNATVAALIVLHELQMKYPHEASVDDKIKESGLSLLDAMRFSEGGFKAVINAPLPDILSTATTLFAFQELNYQISEEFKKKTLSMIEDHWSESGGFFGNQGESEADCEYTFYALLALGALS